MGLHAAAAASDVDLTEKKLTSSFNEENAKQYWPQVCKHHNTSNNIQRRVVNTFSGVCSSE